LTLHLYILKLFEGDGSFHKVSPDKKNNSTNTQSSYIVEQQ
jgi:hypothetical protein